MKDLDFNYSVIVKENVYILQININGKPTMINLRDKWL